jgi:acetolactate synthase-1/2/3 large subunit
MSDYLVRPRVGKLVIAVASAFDGNSAMLNITGNVPTGQWNRGPFQEQSLFDSVEFILMKHRAR